MSSASPVSGKCFTFHLWYTDLKLSLIHGSAWMPRNWKWHPKKTKKKGMRLNSYYITKCNYKAFNHLCCPADQLCGIVPKLENVQLGVKSCSRRVKAIHREEGEKTQTGWRGPWRAPSQLRSFTHLLWVSTKWVTEGWGVCLWTSSRVCSVSAGHTGIKANWRRLW